MSKVSTLIGEVVEGEPVFSHEYDGEQFFKIRVKFQDATIDVMFSEYIIQGKFTGKVKVTGYLASDVVKGSDPRFYFYASIIESVDLDTPTTNEITFSYKVTRVGEFKVSSRGVDILPLVASDYTTFKTTSVLYLCIRGKGARKLKDKEKGYYISGKGYLKQCRNAYEVIVMKLEDDAITESK